MWKRRKFEVPLTALVVVFCSALLATNVNAIEQDRAEGDLVAAICSGQNKRIDWGDMNDPTDDLDGDGVNDGYSVSYECGDTGSKADSIIELGQKALENIGSKANPCSEFKCVQPDDGGEIKCKGYQIDGYQGFIITHDGTAPDCGYTLEDTGAEGGHYNVTCNCIECD